jgi:hypothetical protein
MFSFQRLNKCYENGILKDHLDAKKYIEKHFYPLTNREHELIEEDKVTIIPIDTIKDIYMEGFPDNIKKWYEKSAIPKSLYVM